MTTHKNILFALFTFFDRVKRNAGVLQVSCFSLKRVLHSKQHNKSTNLTKMIGWVEMFEIGAKLPKTPEVLRINIYQCCFVNVEIIIIAIQRYLESKYATLYIYLLCQYFISISFTQNLLLYEYYNIKYSNSKWSKLHNIEI